MKMCLLRREREIVRMMLTMMMMEYEFYHCEYERMKVCQKPERWVRLHYIVYFLDAVLVCHRNRNNDAGTLRKLLLISTVELTMQVMQGAH